MMLLNPDSEYFLEKLCSKMNPADPHFDTFKDPPTDYIGYAYWVDREIYEICPHDRDSVCEYFLLPPFSRTIREGMQDEL